MRLSGKANGTSCLVFVVPKQGANLRLTVSASNACIPSLLQQCDLAGDEKPWRLLQPGFMVYGGGLIWCMVYVWWGPDKVQHGFVINCVRLCLTDPPEINTVPSCTQKAQQILLQYHTGTQIQCNMVSNCTKDATTNGQNLPNSTDCIPSDEAAQMEIPNVNTSLFVFCSDITML